MTKSHVKIILQAAFYEVHTILGRDTATECMECVWTLMSTQNWWKVVFVLFYEKVDYICFAQSI